MLHNTRAFERYFFCSLLSAWILWNVHFAVQAFRVQRLEPLNALQSQVPIRLQDVDTLSQGSSPELRVGGLAPRLSQLVLDEHHRTSRAG